MPDQRLMGRRAVLEHYKRLHPDDDAYHYTDLVGDRSDPGAAAWFMSASQVAARPVTWLWPGRIPAGKLTLLDGDPGLGKSTLLLDLAARLSAGRPMPDQPELPTDSPSLAPSRVLLLSAEDGLADTIRPRLEAARADLDNVLIVNQMPPSYGAVPLRIPEHLPFLNTTVRQLGIRLVIFDPLAAYLGQGVDVHNDQRIRQALHPLARQADQSGVAIIAVRHLSKRLTANVLYRGGGSIGLIGAARSGLLVARDPDDPIGARRVLASAKLNLGPPPPSLAFRLVPAPHGVAAVVWDGPSPQTAANLLTAPERDPDRGDAVSEAKAVLLTLLAQGPLPARTVLQQGLDAGLNRGCLRRAKTALGVRSHKQGGSRPVDQPWFWSLPDQLPATEQHPGSPAA